jgi:hypothetical protein
VQKLNKKTAYFLFKSYHFHDHLTGLNAEFLTNNTVFTRNFQIMMYCPIWDTNLVDYYGIWSVYLLIVSSWLFTLLNSDYSNEMSFWDGFLQNCSRKPVSFSRASRVKMTWLNISTGIRTETLSCIRLSFEKKSILGINYSTHDVIRFMPVRRLSNIFNTTNTMLLCFK